MTVLFVLSPRARLSSNAHIPGSHSHYLLFMLFRVIFLCDSHLYI